MNMKGHVDALPTVSVLGLSFTTAGPKHILEYLAQGGYVVAPAAPALVDLPKNTVYRKALEEADVVIADSGFMVVCWRLLRGPALPRISGLQLFESWVEGLHPENISETFWIHPNSPTQQAHRAWLNKRSLTTQDAQHYLAPLYDPEHLRDEELLKRLHEHKPRWIVINLGGGTQEVLGQYLRDRLEHPSGILCTGAAMAFLSGAQVKIPTWADRLMLGWLFRCFSNPRAYIPRYLKGWKLLPLLIRFRENTPS